MADERGRGAGLPDYTLFPGPGGASPGSGASSPECPRPAGGSPPHLRAEPWPLQVGKNLPLPPKTLPELPAGCVPPHPPLSPAAGCGARSFAQVFSALCFPDRVPGGCGARCGTHTEPEELGEKGTEQQRRMVSLSPST
ncbi:formin-like protein 3 isoform X1 [Calypte anna]|uniref:formin-like protein 3 isoform X1 n=1 Tax=Calypte anna TaxID=9244 RepID=UPI0011C3F94E|nr:formin-like protein 3 isoform X1 [Calypte anna]